MEYEMNSGKLYDSEEKMTRSNVVELMANAKDCVFTVTFNTKADEKYVQEQLKSVDKDVWTNSAKLKAFSKDLTTGKECTMTCQLLKSENKLGRSTVINLEVPPNTGFR